jgi:hypothetical protein
VYVLADVGREHHDLHRALREVPGDLGEAAEPLVDRHRQAEVVRAKEG